MTDQYSRSQPSSPPSAGQETADERRPMTENEIFVTLMARMVLAALTLCWLALCAYMRSISSPPGLGDRVLFLGPAYGEASERQ
jgi:hypothetical protein